MNVLTSCENLLILRGEWEWLFGRGLGEVKINRRNVPINHSIEYEGPPTRFCAFSVSGIAWTRWVWLPNQILGEEIKCI